MSSGFPVVPFFTRLYVCSCCVLLKGFPLDGVRVCVCVGVGVCVSAHTFPGYWHLLYCIEPKTLSILTVSRIRHLFVKLLHSKLFSTSWMDKFE